MGRKLRLLLFFLTAIAAVVVCVRYIAIRDDLNGKRQAIQEKWRQVEAALDRRANVLPSLMEATGQFPADGPLAQELARARANLTGARGPGRKIRANREVSLVLTKVLLHCDTNKKVRASAAFRTLRESMAQYDDEMARERFAYNDALEHYNAQLQRFPDNVVALIGGYARDDSYFETGPDAGAAAGALH